MVARVGSMMVIGFLLASCASTQPNYVPARGPGDYGYTERQLDNRRFRVSFQGDTRTEVEEVYDFVMIRASEVTLNQGYDWFLVLDRFQDRDERRGRTYVDPGPNYAVTRECGMLSCRSTVTEVYGPSGWYEGPPRDQYRISIEIVMGEGRRPPQDPNAYDARNVIDRLGYLR